MLPDCRYCRGGITARISDFAQGVDDPAAAADVAESIVDYELPLGYEEQGAMNLLGFRMAFIAAPDQQSVIMLAEFPEALAGNEEQMQQQMRDAFAINLAHKMLIWSLWKVKM